MKKYDVLILGSGMGGLASAVLLAKQGKKVAILEKNPMPGGRLTSWEKEGFNVDLGVHVISRGAKGPVYQCLEESGIPFDLSFTTVRPTSSYKGEIYKFPKDVAKYVPEEDFESFMRFMGDIRSYDEAKAHEFDDLTLDQLLDQYTTNSFVHQAVSAICNIYTEAQSHVVAAGDFINCLNWEAAAHASGYPTGGCVAIPREYIKVINALGGEVFLNTPVEQILLEGDTAVGVIAGGEEWRADIIVSNLGIRVTMFDFVGKDKLEEDYIKYLESLVYTGPSCILRIALNKVVTDVKMFSTVADTPCAEYEEKLLRDEFDPSGVSVFLVSPSNFSPGICDPDKQYITCTTALPFGVSRKMQESIMDYLFNVVISMFPEAKDSIIWTDRTYVDELTELCGKEGTGLGIAQIVGQTGKNAPKAETPIKNLYLVGTETGGKGGVGIERAVYSAYELVENYLNK